MAHRAKISLTPLTLLQASPESQEAGSSQQHPQQQKRTTASVTAETDTLENKYHVVTTVDGGVYTEWQVRIHYYWYNQMRLQHPDSSMGGFTRLLHRCALLYYKIYGALGAHRKSPEHFIWTFDVVLPHSAQHKVRQCSGMFCAPALVVLPNDTVPAVRPCQVHVLLATAMLDMPVTVLPPAGNVK